MTQTPAGWYPVGDGTQRYWDGQAWTNDIQPLPGQAPAAQTPAAPPGYGAPAAAGAPAGAGGTWPPNAYLEGAGSDFQGALRNAIDNIFVFSGRASRSSYWFLYLAVVVIIVAAWIVVAILGAISDVLGTLAGILLFVGYIGAFIVSLSAGVRRLHDTDRSGWWYLICLVPFVGGIILLVFFILEGTKGPNQYNSVAYGGQATDIPVKP